MFSQHERPITACTGSKEIDLLAIYGVMAENIIDGLKCICLTNWGIAHGSPAIYYSD